MMITKHSSNFMDSEVMLSLQAKAVKKGHFEPTPEELIEDAVFKMNKKAALKPTGNLYSDIMLLASRLEAKGLKNQAEEIRQKAFILKTAETHLYRVFDEDGADVIDRAHPDGDADVLEAQQDLGSFETIVGRHIKFLEVVKKQPTGKNYSSSHESHDADDEIDDEENDEDEDISVYAAFVNMNSGKKAEAQLTSPLDVPLIAPTPTGSLPPKEETSRNNWDNSLQENFQFRKRQPNESLAEYNDALEKFVAQKKLTEKRQGKQVTQQLSDKALIEAGKKAEQLKAEFEAGEIADVNVAALDEKIKAGQQATERVSKSNSNGFNIKIIPTAAQNYNYSYNIWKEILSKLEGNSDDAKTAETNMNASADLVTILANFVKNKNLTLPALKEALNGFVTIKTEADLDAHAKKWVSDTESYAKSVNAFKKDELKKLADLSVIPLGAKNVVNQSESEPAAKPVAQPAVQNQAPAKSGPARPTKEEFRYVSLMQKQLSDLSIGLNAEAEKIAAKINAKPDQVKALARIMGDTGIGTNNPFDGMWGSKTIESLKGANKLSQLIKTEPLAIGSNFKTTPPEQIISDAQKNQNALAQLMQGLGLDKYMKAVPPTVEKTLASNFDHIPDTLSQETLAVPESDGKWPVKPNTFDNLSNFFMLLNGLGIKSASVKTAQVDTTNPYAPKGMISIEDFEKALHWFYQRSASQETQLSKEKAAGNPITDSDIENKQNYNNAIRKLWGDWSSGLKEFFLSDKNPNKGYVDKQLLDQATGQKSTTEQSPEKAKSAPEKSDEDKTEQKTPATEAAQNPPFTDRAGTAKLILDMIRLADKYESDPGYYEAFMSNAILDRRRWMSGSWENLYPIYASDGAYAAMEEANPSKVPPPAQQWMASRPNKKLPGNLWFMVISEHIKRDLNKIFSNWYAEISELPGNAENLQRLIRANQRELGKWVDIITQVQRNTARAGLDAR